MVRPASDPTERIRAFALAAARGEVDLGAWLEDHPTTDESEIADVIDADGRARTRLGLGALLDRYIGAIPGLAGMPVALDAAIEATLRSMCASGRTEDEAAATLLSAHPELTTEIEETVSLNRGMWSTRWIVDRLGAPATPELPCAIGPTIDSGMRRYELIEVLGHGSCGEVFLAIDRQLSDTEHDALVAIKLLDGAGATPDARRRFCAEASLARRVEHPTVVRVLDRGETDDGGLYIVSERVHGKTLAQWVAGRGGRVEPRRAASIIARVARGVHAAHAAGLIHCDLHPTNVLIDERAEPRICDFGIAVLHEELRAGSGLESWGGRALGSLAFIPPEQFGMEDLALGCPADVYALGGLLQFMLTGGFPNGDDEAEIRERLADGRGAADRVDATGPLDHDLALILRRALDADPVRRHASASEIADDLDAWRQLRPIEWAKPSPARRARLFVRRRPLLTVMSLLAILGAIGGASALSYTHGVVTTRHQQVVTWVTELREDASAADRKYEGNVALAFFWILDRFIVGSWMGGDGKLPDLLDDAQLDTLRQLVERTYEHGDPTDPELLMLESALAVIMLADTEAVNEDARAVIDRNRASWANLLPEGHRRLRELEMFGAVIDVKEQWFGSIERIRAGDAPFFDADVVRRAERTLLDSLELYQAGWYEHTDPHMLAIRALRALYGEALLRDAVAYETYRRQYLEMAGKVATREADPKPHWNRYAEWLDKYGARPTGP